MNWCENKNGIYAVGWAYGNLSVTGRVGERGGGKMWKDWPYPDAPTGEQLFYWEMGFADGVHETTLNPNLEYTLYYEEAGV